MDEFREGLDVVARQRQAAAARVRLGWWVPALAAVSWACTAGGVFPAEGYARLGIADLPYGQVGGLVFLATIVVFSVRSGMNRRDTWPFAAYPSLRRRFSVLVVACVASLVAEFGLGRFGGASIGVAWAAVVVAVASGVAIAFVLCWMVAGIRGDIRAGGEGR